MNAPSKTTTNQLKHDCTYNMEIKTLGHGLELNIALGYYISLSLVSYCIRSGALIGVILLQVLNGV